MFVSGDNGTQQFATLWVVAGERGQLDVGVMGCGVGSWAWPRGRRGVGSSVAGRRSLKIEGEELKTLE